MTQYREVKRKANVGERIKIVAATGFSEEIYVNGDVLTVTDVTYANCGAVDADFNRRSQHVFEREYVVLEPVDSAPLSAKPAQEQRDDIVANLAARVSALESEVAALKAPRIVTSPETLAAFNERYPLRDEIVERAKRDVATLLNRNYSQRAGYSPSIWLTDKDGSCVTDECKFVINRDKRTVVALIITRCGNVIYRGIAKCAPGDVFNTHIGRAVALRRALGIPVPDEYISAPKPTEVRVGDIVAYTFERAKPTVTWRVDSLSDQHNLTVLFTDNGVNIGEKATGGNLSWSSVIDDSREETEATA